MNIGLLLDFRIRGIPNVTRRALGMAKRTVDSKQGVRSNDRNGDRGPQPSLEWPQKCSMGRRWVQVASGGGPGTRRVASIKYPPGS